MNGVTCKRFEASAARQLAGRTEGRNFVVWVGIAGPVQADTGVVIYGRRVWWGSWTCATKPGADVSGQCCLLLL
jgi:hypothetical protein